MKDFTIESLQYALDVSNGVEPNNIESEGSEADILHSLGYVSEICAVDSTEFETVYIALGADKFCDINTFRVAVKLRHTSMNRNMEETEATLSELIELPIPGQVFNKAITDMCVTTILSLQQISKYRNYISRALPILKDKSVETAGFFIK